MVSTFYINQFNSNYSGSLLVEVGEKHFCFCIRQQDEITTLAWYNLSDADSTECQIEKILQEDEVFKNSFSKVDVIYATKESCLFPASLYNTNAAEETLKLKYGSLYNSIIKSDFIYKHNMHNTYAINENLHRVLEQKFNFFNTTHQYSLLADIAFNANDKLFVIFYEKYLVAVLYKNGKLALSQYFNYKNEADVAYYLLSMVQQTQLSAIEISIELNGLISDTSTLYKELYKYFGNLSFPSYQSKIKVVEEIKKMPTHYFNHLLQYNLCV